MKHEVPKHPLYQSHAKKHEASMPELVMHNTLVQYIE